MYISVIMPAYYSQATIAVALESVLAQTRPADEILLIDSSPDEASAEAVQPYVGRITLVRPDHRLYPHEARNLAAGRARGDLLVFTDPDIAAEPEWLARLEAAYVATGHVIVGAVDCYGRRWTDVGAHLCKFDKWLPSGAAHALDIGPSINLCVPRAAFDAVGGFPADPMLGDTTLSWALRERGYTLWFEPGAVVAHHHVQSVPALYRERLTRGREFGVIRMQHAGWNTSHIIVWLLVSVLPLRLFNLMLRRVRHARAAGWLGWLGWTWPVVLVGEAGWVWGESAAYAAELRARSRSRRAKKPV
ncbi:MAG TPA: glycosyltransferase [Candidatus Limnocylindrales bacterium]|nr:glycosyltransferase [Candidatus Limnocylindrales bacterium]